MKSETKTKGMTNNKELASNQYDNSIDNLNSPIGVNSIESTMKTIDLFAENYTYLQSFTQFLSPWKNPYTKIINYKWSLTIF